MGLYSVIPHSAAANRPVPYFGDDVLVYHIMGWYGVTLGHLELEDSSHLMNSSRLCPHDQVMYLYRNRMRGRRLIEDF